MLIGFDIDDTIGDCLTPSFVYMNEKFGMMHTPESVARWVKEGGFNPKGDLFRQLYNITESDIMNIFDTEAFSIYQTMPVFNSAITELNRLVAEGHTVVYVTARRGHWREVTEQWLWSMGAAKSDVYFTHQKAELSIELGIKRFYEDNIKNILSLRAVGVECVLVDYLQNGWAELKGVERVYWNDPITTINLAIDNEDATVA
jgi:uncharacterized HAD superfamily protein